jgi:tRNA G10  N-methylase Trm11
MKYLILQNPGHNRVYYNLADQLALGELEIAAKRLDANVEKVDIEFVAGIRYLSIETSDVLCERDMGIISRLSFVFAIFQYNEECKCLSPIKIVDYEFVGQKISSLLKYQGKTNELFTKMMVNVALLSSDFNYDDVITLLDPVAGKGTTLFEALVYGFDAYGIELESGPVHEATTFFKKYLETEKLKHIAEQRRIAGTNKNNEIQIKEFKFAQSKEAFKSGEGLKQFGMITGNAAEAHTYFKKPVFNIIVGDLPYGIYHGNRSFESRSGATRNPSELLAECLPGWFKVLKKGGTIVLAWNSFVVSPKKLAEIFENNGFTVQNEGPYKRFEHMVDKSIKRDVIVAKKI